MFTKDEIDKLYPNPWNFKVKPEFTALEIAAMEGGHSIEVEATKDTYSFIKYVTQETHLRAR